MEKTEEMPIDNLWKLPETLKAVEQEASKERYDSDVLEKLEEKHEIFLNRVSGVARVIKFNKLVENNNRLEGDDAANSELTDFMYESGLSDMFPTRTILRTRRTLESALEHIGRLDEEIVIADIGSGDGMIAIGLAQHPKVKRIYAIDRSPEASKRMQLNMSKLSAEHKDTVYRKIILITTDYSKEEGIKKIKSEVGDSANYALIAYAFKLPLAVDSALEILNKSGRIVLYYPFEKGQKEAHLVRCMNAELIGRNIDFKLFDKRVYYAGEKFIGVESIVQKTD